MGRLVAGAFVVIVLGIDTATQQTSVAIGTERGTRAQMALSATARSHEEVVIPTFHPAAVLRGGGAASKQMEAIRSDFAGVKQVLAERPEPVEEQLDLFG